jgi:hypothetical protein
MADSNDGLEILIKSKILNDGITLKGLMEVAKQLDNLPGGAEGKAKWVFIVKGKFIYRDDSEA